MARTDSRSYRIQQAVTMIRARTKWSVDEALLCMQEHARRASQTLEEIAIAILDPESDSVRADVPPPEIRHNLRYRRDDNKAGERGNAALIRMTTPTPRPTIPPGVSQPRAEDRQQYPRPVHSPASRPLTLRMQHCRTRRRPHPRRLANSPCRPWWLPSPPPEH